MASMIVHAKNAMSIFGGSLRLACSSAHARTTLLILAMLYASIASGQESSISWTTSISGSPTYQTLGAAEAAIRAHYAADMTLRRQKVTSTGTTLEYWRGRRGPNVGDFDKYESITETHLGEIFPTEQDSVDQAVTYYSGLCNVGASVMSNGEWTPEVLWNNGQATGEKRTYKISYRGGSTCTQDYVIYPVMRRRRTIACPSDRNWDNNENACLGSTFGSIYASQKLECYECALVGDPIDVTTGDLYETEDDFALGWIDFKRYYHSITLTGQGIFGNGSWVNSHGIRVSLSSGSTPAPQGVLLENGSQVSVQSVSGEYELVDGTGDRIKSDGAGGWALQRADRTLKFDSSGRLVAQAVDDGSSLAYSYDVNKRLSKITSNTGRSIDFVYSDPYGDAAVSSISSDGVVLVSYSYTSGRLTGATYPGSGTRNYEYTDSRFPNALTAIKAEDGSTYATFAYDSAGRAISSQRAGGVDAVTLTYNSSGGATVTSAVTGTTSLVSTYGLTAAATGVARKVAGVTYDGHSLTRTYNASSSDFRRRLATLTDRNGVVTQYTYSEGTDPVTSTAISTRTTKEAVGAPEERSIVESKGLSSNRLMTRVQGNRQMRISRNARLQPQTSVMSDLGSGGGSRTITYTYCESADVSAGTCPQIGLLRSVDGPRTDVNDITSYTYYASDDATCASAPATCPHRKNDLWKVTDALGHVVERLKYDGQGRLLSWKDANGVVTDLEYTTRGWPSATKIRGSNDSVETDDRIARVDYWPTGQIKKVTRADGIYATFTYDAAQRLTDVTDNLGNTMHYTLDAVGNRRQEDTKDSVGTVKRTLSRIYNTLSQLKTQADASSNPTDFTYDANGNRDTVTDALGRVMDEDVDPLNRLKRTLQDVGSGRINAETKFQYDSLDQLTQVTDPKGLNTTYAYNGFGDVTQLVSPDTGTTTYTYDSAGNRATQVDARGVTTSYAYDALNRLASVSYSDGTAGITYTYDSGSSTACQQVGATVSYVQGRMTRITDVTGYTEYCYNRFGDLIGKSQANAQTFNVRYGYAVSGRLQNMTYPDGTVVDYVYNNLGQVVAIGSTPSGGVREVLLKQASYAPFGPVAGWTWNNGRTLQRPVDLDYRTTKVYDSGTGGLSSSYHYDPVGNIDQLWDGLQTAQQAGYDYDRLDRLAVTKGPTNQPVESYGYDATGNRTSFTNTNGTQTYAYLTTNHRLMSIGGSLRGYDAAGNTTSIDALSRQYIYDGAGRMKQAKQGTLVLMNYRYNGRGERTRQFSGDPATTSVYTAYDENGHWLGDYDANGVAKQQAIWLGDLPVGLLVGTGASQQLNYVEADKLGSPRVVIDPDRDVAVWKWDAKSEAFGSTVPTQDPDNDSVNFTLDMRFPGQRFDAASKLSYNYFRDYDPTVGRYIQSDPIGFAGGTNTYSYVSGSPGEFIDPFGLCQCWPTEMVDAAKSREGESGWGNPGWRGGPGWITEFKCNKFVEETSRKSGSPPPLVNNRPATAGELADPNQKIENWPVVHGPAKSGDIVAISHSGPGYTGHTGVVVGPSQTASANSETRTVTVNDWGFRKGQAPVVRRCSCP